VVQKIKELAMSIKTNPLIFLLLIFTLSAYPLQAQISLDGTMGRSGSLKGPHYQIDETMGHQVGTNLFHSFGEFNIHKGEIATFTGPDAIDNVISRVTGGNFSLIDGLLQSTIQGADFFLFNPQGVIFGPDGHIDVNGSFHLSTADYLGLGDTGRFDALRTEDSILTAAPPSAFGFLSDHPAAIRILEPTVRYKMKVPQGETLSLVGGDIEITGRDLASQAGQINIASLASSGEAVLKDSGIDTAAFEDYGNISLSGGSLEVNGLDQVSGSICIRGGQFVTTGRISSFTHMGEGGDIDIRLNGDMTLSGGRIATAAEGDGRAGDVILNAKNLEITDGGILSAMSYGDAQSGDISVTARDSLRISGGNFQNMLSANAEGSGNAGNISVHAGTLEVGNNGLISAVAKKDGDSGNISIGANQADISDGGLVISSAYGSGQSGDISVDSLGSVNIIGYGKDSSALSAAAYGDGDAGNISAKGKYLTLANEGFITAAAHGTGHGGNVRLEADVMKITSGGSVTTGVSGAGNGGDISVTANESISISGTGWRDNPSGLYANTEGTGNAGSIAISSKALNISDAGIVTSSTSGDGRGGNIAVTGDRLNLTQGGKIVAKTYAAGDGGEISVTAHDALTISGESSGLYAVSDAESKGHAGNTTVSAKTLTIENKGVISGEAGGDGNGGDVTLTADDLKIDGGALVTTTTEGAGHGGDISIIVQNTASISGGEAPGGLTANTGGSGDAGNIDISANLLTVKNKGVIFDQTYGTGRSGNITINVEQMEIGEESSVSTDTRGGNHGGDISLTARNELTISGNSELSATTKGRLGPGDAGHIRISAGVLNVTDDGLINNGTSGQGRGGDIDISAGVLSISDDGLINNGTAGEGDGGNIVVSAGRINMSRGYITSSAEEESTGSGGDISITANESVHVEGSGEKDAGEDRPAPYYGIYAQTQGPGDGGHIAISAKELSLAKDGWINGQTYSSGHGGNITLDADRLEVHEGGTITTSTRCTGDAGDISITASESVNVSGAGEKQERSWIFSATYCSGRGGDIRISTPELNVGEAGAVYADTTLPKEPGDCCEQGTAVGRAGDIYLNTDRLKLTDGGIVSASTQTEGQGGNILIIAGDSLIISGTGLEHRGLKDSGIYARTQGSGDGGTVQISAGTADISDKGQINTSSEKTGEGGDISLTASTLNLSNSGHIESSAKGEGKGGEIDITASDFVTMSGNESGFYSTAESSGTAGIIRARSPFLTMSDHAEISTESSGTGKAGDIFIEDDLRKLSLQNAVISSSNTADGDAGKIVIHAEESAMLEAGAVTTEAFQGQGGNIAITSPELSASKNSLISASVREGTKDGGKVEVAAETLHLNSGSRIESSAGGKGNGGEVGIQSSESLSLSGKRSGLYSIANSAGNAGLITAKTPILTMNDGAEISTESSGSGKAGDILLEEELRKLSLKDSSISSSNTGTGDAGKILVYAKESAMLEAGFVTTEAAEGAGGSIRIQTAELSGSENSLISASVREGTKDGGKIETAVETVDLRSGSRIESSTGGEGNGGEIEVRASESMKISGKNSGLYSIATSAGNAGLITAKTPALIMDSSAEISTESSGSGKAGDILLEDDLRELSLKDSVVSSANTGTGDAGKISIRTETSVILKRADVSTDAAEGKGGTISVTTSELSASDESRISAAVRGGTGKGGDVTLHADRFDLHSGSHIEASTSGEGQGGTLKITASDIQLNNGASMSARSFGSGNAGDISIRAADTFRMEKSHLTTEAQYADGGNITVNTPKMLRMNDSTITATVGGGAGNGGNITMSPDIGIAENSRIIANAYQGKGGNIRIVSDGFIQNAATVISASSELGIDGSVEIESNDITSDLSALPADFLNAERWMKTPCAARSGADASRMIVAGRNGIPMPHDDWLASPPIPFSTRDLEEAGEAARFLADGEKKYSKGDTASAMQAWEGAIPLLNTDSDAYLHTILYLTDAYQSRGQYQKASALLDQAFSLVEETGNSYAKAMLLSRLGDLSLVLGDVKQAALYLQEAGQAKSPDALPHILNGKGNVRAADADYQGAAKVYKNAIETSGHLPFLKSKILLNLTRSRLMKGDYREAVRILDKAAAHLETLPDSRHKSRDLLSAGLLARNIGEAYPAGDSHLRRVADQSFRRAKIIGETLKDPRIISYACGYLGQCREAAGDAEEALRLTRQGIFFAQQENDPEILYLWQWQAGRLLKDAGDVEKSLKAYDEAVNTLNPIRKEFFTGYRGKKDIFHEKLKPVYLELADLLLKQAETAETENEREAALRKAMDTMELLKIAELEDYFEDECVTAKPAKSGSPYAMPARTAGIYPILFPDHLALLLIFPDSIRQISVPASADDIQKQAGRFRERLQKEKSKTRILHYAKLLYDVLIRPAEKEFATRKIDTLVIAPDGVLRSIPFSALHDGEHFLIEKYAVATVPGIMLTDISPFQLRNKRVLLCGLSEGVQGFHPIPGVEKEFEAVGTLIEDGDTFLNGEYTLDNLFQRFKNHTYGIIHMATHGVFGRSPKDTFLLTYDGKMIIDQVESLIGLGKYRDKQLELLTLSACQTAMGDERAALGLAGVALKAGAKSAIATLWSVYDESAAGTITEFYRQIGISGMTKAKAMQNAQKRLIDQHPSYWAPFLLIGNWL
jgi:filamentous hemagglutinin family protein